VYRFGEREVSEREKRTFFESEIIARDSKKVALQK